MSADWRPTAGVGALRLRARMYATIRGFFAARGVLEVETPILSQAGNTDPNIESFATRFDGHVGAGTTERWMRTSPEFPLKRLLAAGIGDCYELGRVFRNGEVGRRHNPEFTMLEWYRVGWDHRRLMRETAELVLAVLALAGRTAQVRETTYRDLFVDALGIDPLRATDDALRAPLEGIEIEPGGLRRDDWLDLLLTHRIQPAFARDRILLVHDYPASQCALARIRAGAPPVAERFELYLGPVELANGYHELTDAIEQRARFEHDLAQRASRHAARPPLDERLLHALGHGLPDCAGVAMGVDRLLGVLLDADSIASTLAFGFERA
jgi:lysyl-tRNA synthetase class 2